MRHIIKNKKPGDIPSEPKLNVPQRASLSILGTRTDDVKDLDQKYMVDEEEFKKKADEIRKQHEAKGGGSIYYYLQPFSRPELSVLIGRLIDVYSQFNTGLRWCQGEVLNVVVNAKKLTVNVLWDDIPNGPPKYEKQVEDPVELLQGNWKKDSKNGWRMDV